jgi:hypothetical protein
MEKSLTSLFRDALKNLFFCVLRGKPKSAEEARSCGGNALVWMIIDRQNLVPFAAIRDTLRFLL